MQMYVQPNTSFVQQKLYFSLSCAFRSDFVSYETPQVSQSMVPKQGEKSIKQSVSD